MSYELDNKVYGRAHRKVRAHLLRQLKADVDAGKQPWPCPRCGLDMLAWMPLDVGHSTPMMKQQRLPGDRLEHAHCNRSAQDGPDIVQPIGHVQSRDW